MNTVATSMGSTNWGEPEHVFRRLIGSWTFERTVAGYGTMAGVAVFADADDGWVGYRETGELRLDDGRTLQAQREYVFRPTPDGFDVYFKEDPIRLFQQVILRRADANLCGTGEHQCSADLYTSTYEFRSDGAFVIRHVARGPHKDYTMVTTYRPAVTA
jgi:hypothetical protein